MKYRSCLVVVLTLVIEFNLPPEEPLADSTIVVYNKAVPESVELAKFYAGKRGIAPDHLIGLDCSTQEEITREQYDATIAEPLRAVFRQRHWWTVNESPSKSPVVTASSIHFVAIIKGVALKIHSADSYSGDQQGKGPIGSRNKASVDSEMAVLAAYSRQISGVALNPYFRSFRLIAEFGNPGLLLVCRLDAANTETIRRMVVDAIAMEKNGLWGRAYVDAGNKTVSAGATGDEWLAEIVGQLHKAGIPVVYENAPALFPEAYPMTDCALYYGWYAGKVTGPFTCPDFRFVPGAIAVHIDSFSREHGDRNFDRGVGIGDITTRRHVCVLRIFCKRDRDAGGEQGQEIEGHFASVSFAVKVSANNSALASFDELDDLRDLFCLR
jgi:uncharacterized protein (TIGR03790 family)